jgi:hypothetical protein
MINYPCRSLALPLPLSLLLLPLLLLLLAVLVIVAVALVDAFGSGLRRKIRPLASRCDNTAAGGDTIDVEGDDGVDVDGDGRGSSATMRP